MPGVETVDATGVDTSFVAHSYYGSVRTVLSDIFYIVHRACARIKELTFNPQAPPPQLYPTFAK